MACYLIDLPRSPGADEAGGRCHVLNRSNLRATIFTGKGDYVAFKKTFCEGLERLRMELFSRPWTPSH
jgi:putative transposase